MEERITTLHPAGKKGVRILLTKYLHIKEYIVDQLTRHEVLTFSELADNAVNDLKNTFDGSPMWYITTVKLDLEARGIIERIPKTSPHQLRLVQ